MKRVDLESVQEWVGLKQYSDSNNAADVIRIAPSVVLAMIHELRLLRELPINIGGKCVVCRVIWSAHRKDCPVQALEEME